MNNIFYISPESFTQEEWCKMHISLIEYSKKMHKEIEQLNNIINTMDKEIDNLCKNQKKEIERLNNIINELEIWLKKICEKEFVFEDGEDYCTERAYGCKECLNKLNELKESGNNE